MSKLSVDKIGKTGIGAAEFTLPATDGSSGQVWKSDGSGVLSVGGLDSSQITATGTASASTFLRGDNAWAAPSSLFSSYAIIADQKASGTAGGTFTTGAWRTRDLNTEITDPDGIVSIASDQFTLAAGSYLIKWTAPAYITNDHQTRLYNVTDTASVAVGGSTIAYDGYVVQNSSSGAARTVIAGSKAFSIEHRCQTTSSTHGFGHLSNFATEQYTIVEIFKEA